MNSFYIFVNIHNFSYNFLKHANLIFVTRYHVMVGIIGYVSPTRANFELVALQLEVSANRTAQTTLPSFTNLCGLSAHYLRPLV